MTTQDYIRIVEDLATSLNKAVASQDITKEQSRAVASHFAHEFAYTERRNNPRFSDDKFYRYVQKMTGADMAVR